MMVANHGRVPTLRWEASAIHQGSSLAANKRRQSLGDILALINLLETIISGLKDHGGAADDFR